MGKRGGRGGKTQKPRGNRAEPQESTKSVIKTPSQLTDQQIEEFKQSGAQVIDGSVGEGGGQVLRISTGLAAILQKKLVIHKIRNGRTKPGLLAQHLNGVRLVSEVHNSELQGDEMGSRVVILSPNRFSSKTNFVADTKTAGSVSLLQQIVLPTLLFGSHPTEIKLGGGTHAIMAPHTEMLTDALLPLLKRMGVSYEVDLERRGYYPKGGGIVYLKVEPVKEILPIELVDRGDIAQIRIRTFVSQLPFSTAETMIKKTLNKISTSLSIESDRFILQAVEEQNGYGRAMGTFICATTDTDCIITSSSIGEKEALSETLAISAADEFVSNWNAQGCVDEYMQDNLIIFMALAKGVSKIRCGPLTLHTTTAIQIISEFLGDIFTVHKQDDGTNIIECRGVGHQNPYL